MSIASSLFIPDTLEQLTNDRVFPQALPEAFYSKMLADYQAVEDVQTSHITYQSDGLKITGLMALPKLITPKKHPVLIYNRGGSREYGRLTLLSAMRSMIPFARAGYLVFASNYRGNNGSEGQEEFGGADVNDVLNLLEIAVGHEGFDGKNRFMLGHSRGGMMTYQAIKKGAKLNAAISLAGMADLFESQSEPMIKLYEKLIPGFAENREQALAERSAIHWPEKITIPLLLLHGTADEAIHHTQSERLAAALTSPSKLQLYEQGNHALVRQWDDVLIRSKQWLEAHKA